MRYPQRLSEIFTVEIDPARKPLSYKKISFRHVFCLPTFPRAGKQKNAGVCDLEVTNWDKKMKNDNEKNTMLKAGFVTLLCGLCNLAAAGPSLGLSVGAWHYGDSQQYTDNNYHIVGARDEGNTDGGGGVVPPYVVSSSASGRADGGVMKAAAKTSYTTGPLASSASAFAQWSDYLTVESDGLAYGTRVQIHYTLDLDAHLSLSYVPRDGFLPYDSSIGFTQWSFSHYLAGNTTQTFGDRIDVLYNGSYVHAAPAGQLSLRPDGKIEMTADVAIGAASYLYMGLMANTFIGNGATVASASGAADLGNSLYWGGISSVTLSDGTSVAFNVKSESGTDYSQSFVPTGDVPEPESLALFALASAAMFLVKRRGR
jgi:hypothetical protein